MRYHQLNIIDITCTILEALVPIQLLVLGFLWGYSITSLIYYVYH